MSLSGGDCKEGLPLLPLRPLADGLASPSFFSDSIILRSSTNNCSASPVTRNSGIVRSLKKPVYLENPLGGRQLENRQICITAEKRYKMRDE